MPKLRDIKIIVYSGSLVLALAAFGLFFAYRLSVWPFTKIVPAKPQAVVFGEDEKKRVAAVAEEFGRRLKKVSLLSPDVSAEIQRNYEGLVVQPLLDRWKADPSKAMGRSVSSPWPERMEANPQYMTQLDDKTFRVAGTIYYYSSDNVFAPAYDETLAFREERINGSWLITEFETYDERDKFPAKYISALRWPPVTKNAEGPFVCEPTPAAASAASKAVSLVTSNGKNYCVTVNREGAAGSVYASYEYATEKTGGGLLSMDFVLRYSNCSNYDAVQAAECVGERELFNLDELVIKRFEDANRAAAPKERTYTEYKPQIPGYFFDPDTEVSFNYPKGWKISYEDGRIAAGFYLKINGADGKGIASFAWPPLETGIEEVVTVKTAKIPARDGSVAQEEVFRSCVEWKSGEECLKTSGPLIGWTHWREGTIYFGGWPEGSAEEKRNLADIEKLFTTLNIGEQPKWAGKTAYRNALLGFSISYPSSWLSYPDPFSEPPLKTEAEPSGQTEHVFIGPKKMLTRCFLLSYDGPARYVNIVASAGSLEENRDSFVHDVNGRKYEERITKLSGKTAYAYSTAYEPECYWRSTQEYDVFLVEHKGRVLEISTDLYNLPDVKSAIESIKFFDQ